MLEQSVKISVQALALVSTMLVVACTSGTEGPSAGNTELNLDIVNPGGTSGELGFSIDRVDYRITCAGSPPGSYPIPDADTVGNDYNYDDSVDISGAFEVVDTRTPPVWQAVMDLPPGDCTITLSVYEDDELVCVGSQTLAINEDGTTKYDIVLVCSLSIDLPDGMADVDGTFELITGNLCPKLYVLNAIPSVVGFAPPRTEVQYRAKDPDNTCGNNCDPQSCDFSNPPVCTPYPSNINDPNCNPALGGDPNSAACLAGDYAGLVCTIVAFEGSGGTPAGNFINPQDGVTPVGPILPLNLNLASGLPGVILPGLGGPAGTNAANSPAYPPLPNVNGSLPPFEYECDPNFPGVHIISVTCSDGDAECDQTKQITISCPGIDFCPELPADYCEGDNDCLTDGVCNQPCDPLCATDQTTYDATLCCGAAAPGDSCGLLECTQCPGQNDPQPAGTSCTDGGGNICDGAGNCVECLVDADCTNLPAPVVPGTCQEPNTCVANACVAGGASPAGTLCLNGTCDGSGIGSSDPPCAFDPPTFVSCNQIITVGCGNNVTADVSILPYELDITATGAIAGNPVTADLGGVAQFSETFLDAAQGAVPGGVTKAILVDLVASVQVRSGSTGAPVTPLGAGSAIPYECALGDTGPGAQQPCNPANDQPSVPGLRPNTDCVPTGTFNPCGRIVVVPTSTDCAPGGVCDTLGKSAQCAANGFCATGGLPLPLDPVFGVSLGTAAASGNLLVGWYDTPADTSVAVGTPPIDGDGTYNMLQPTYTGVAGVVGLAVNAGGLAVQLECVMAVDSGGPDGVGVPDDASPTPDSQLCSFPIQVP